MSRLHRDLQASACPSEVALCHDDAPRLLTQIQICRRFGICDETWRRWRKAGKVPSPVPNLPGAKRWRVADIDRLERGLFGAEGTRVFFGAARRR